METQQHLQIVNPLHKTSLSFTLFPRLPAELRLEIWERSLQRPRFITIDLAQNSQKPVEGGQNRLGRDISGTYYRVRVHGSQLLSKLLRVSHEARDAALQFYRVHIPCRFGYADSGPADDGTFFLNPEFDILNIVSVRYGYHFADFLHDLRAHDPRNVGVLNLALNNSVSSHLITGCRPDFTLSPNVRTGFATVLAGLQQVYLTCLEDAGRLYLGLRTGIPTVPGFELHRSRPIMSVIPAFDCVGPDPRGGDMAMKRDLSRVFVGASDPRETLYFWKRLLDLWQTHRHHPYDGSGGSNGGKGPEYRLLVARGWGNGRLASRKLKISNRASAAEWLRKENERWAEAQKCYADEILKRGGTLPVESPEELERAPRPAIGFWLFPIKALGPMPGPEADSDDYDYSNFPWESHRVLDMHQYWPELCLASMPC